MSNLGKLILLEQLEAVHNQVSWFVPINEALYGLNASQAARRDASATNSVWGLVSHLVFVNERFLNQFLDPKDALEDVDFDTTFEVNQGINEESWQTCVSRLDRVLSEWHDQIANCDEDKLMSSVIPNADFPWWSAIACLTTHTAYHIGQIVHLRKAQGLWQSRSWT